VTIQEIQIAFATEASAAPSLFSDLAKVELYIAESYRSRAFIELLQNADDAGAHRFAIRQAGEFLLVANDGRPFTREDVVALCRSGASNKRRGSGTIGYRGIGFKSVAGIAHEIDVLSGDCRFRFSKTMTQQLIGIESDVPLIRIPHPISAGKPEAKSVAQELIANGMNTVFILSGLDERMVAEEAESFDESAMLFLNSVSQVEIDLPGVKRRLKRITSPQGDALSIEQIGNATERQTWLVAGREGGCEKLAFALDGDMVVAATPKHSVIHSFMPTTEFAGALLKMNGDFSTDPSRKSIDLDDASVRAFRNCVELLAGVLQKAVANMTLPGIFSPFLLTAPVEGRFRNTLREALSEKLDTLGFGITGLTAKPVDIRLRPEWLSYSDYEILCGILPHVPQQILGQHPQFPDFLKWLGARPISIEEALSLVHHVPLSPIGCAQVFSRAARQYRYDLTKERIEALATAPLIPVRGGSVSPRNYKGEPLLPDFLSFLMQQEEIDDIRYLGKRLGLPDGLFGVSVPSVQPNQGTPQTHLNSHPIKDSAAFSAVASHFKTTPAIKAWRSAEQNALAWLSALSDVVSARDVSQANVGYDLEVVKSNGKRMYIEVKSVTRFGDPIRLTNNEHATAYQLGESYLLAFVVNGSDQFDIRFIRNPIRTLSLEKRCEQWSWYSDNYLDNLTELTEK
jgi:hypothetical protein